MLIIKAKQNTTKQNKRVRNNKTNMDQHELSQSKIG